MPPKQCPECGRFLAAAFVAALAEQAAPCPRCGRPLQADHGEPVATGAAVVTADEPAGRAPAVAASAGRGPAVEAVTAPDEQVRDAPAAAPAPERDPLEGWDAPGTPSPRDDLERGPGAVDPATAVPAVLAGSVVGALLGGRAHRRLGALLGALLGAAGALLAARD